MKTALIIVAMALLPAGANGQVITDLFQQGQAQKRYLMQQITALKVYIGYARQGYSIAQNGLDVIGKIKKGDLELHKGYFDSLRSVSPKVSNYSKVAAVLKMQLYILQVYRSTKNALAASGLLPPEELAYVDGVYGNLLEDCAATVDELKDITTSGRLLMTDDERIRRIDNIYSDMQSKYSFVQVFSSQSTLLAAARRQELKEVKNSRTANGIK